MKNIIITGAAGLIGSTLIGLIIKNKKNKILAIDNLSCGKFNNIKNFVKEKNFIFLNTNVSKKNFNSKTKAIIKNNIYNEIWLLAANSDIQKGNINENIDLENTFFTTFYFLKNIQSYITKNTKIIFTSSSAVYGKKLNKINTDDSSLLPISNYGAMKLASESFISYFSNKKQIRHYIYRLPNVIGEKVTHGLLFDMKKKFFSNKNFVQVLGNGNQKKPYAYAEDLIKVIMKLNKLKSSLILNIGPKDFGITVKEIINKIYYKLNSKKKIFYQKKNYGWPGDVPEYYYDLKNLNKKKINLKLSSKEAINKTINLIF
jgi:UDP-glucose 4-epimerase